MTAVAEVGPARDALYRLIKERVASVPSNESAFFTEQELAEAVGTSRTPVREALLQVAAEGLITILPKKGAFAPAISELEMKAVMEARELLEVWAVRRIAEDSGSLVGQLAEVLKDQEDFMQDPVRFIDSDRSFHRLIVATAGNPVVTEFYESLRDRQLRMGLRAVVSSENRVKRVLAEHRAIATALRKGDPDRAAVALKRHLRATLKEYAQ